MVATNPKVLIGCPTSEVKSYALEKFIEGLYTLTYPNFDVLIEDNSPKSDYFHRLQAFAEKWNREKSPSAFSVIRSGFTSKFARERIIIGRNKLRQFVLENNYDYFFSLEQDVIPPADIIERLLAREKKIISGCYFTVFPNYPSVRLVAFKHVPPANPAEPLWDVGPPLGIMEVLPSRVLDVSVVGVGCLLIHSSVLEKVSFRYDSSTDASDDMFFCYDARKAGYSIYLDSSQFCQHYYDSWGTEYRKKGVY